MENHPEIYFILRFKRHFAPGELPVVVVYVCGARLPIVAGGERPPGVIVGGGNLRYVDKGHEDGLLRRGEAVGVPVKLSGLVGRLGAQSGRKPHQHGDMKLIGRGGRGGMEESASGVVEDVLAVVGAV